MILNFQHNYLRLHSTCWPQFGNILKYDSWYMFRTTSWWVEGENKACSYWCFCFSMLLLYTCSFSLYVDTLLLPVINSYFHSTILPHLSTWTAVGAFNPEALLSCGWVVSSVRHEDTKVGWIGLIMSFIGLTGRSVCGLKNVLVFLHFLYPPIFQP